MFDSKHRLSETLSLWIILYFKAFNSKKDQLQWHTGRGSKKCQNKFHMAPKRPKKRQTLPVGTLVFKNARHILKRGKIVAVVDFWEIVVIIKILHKLFLWETKQQQTSESDNGAAKSGRDFETEKYIMQFVTFNSFSLPPKWK